MKLLIIAHGGKNNLSKAWEVPCPFEKETASEEDLEVFADQIVSAFSGVIDWPISAEYIEGDVNAQIGSIIQIPGPYNGTETVENPCNGTALFSLKAKEAAENVLKSAKASAEAAKKSRIEAAALAAKSILIIFALFFASCARQTFIPAGVLIRAGEAKIEKCVGCDLEAFVIYFPREVYFADFKGLIPGVLSISQNDKYSIVVRVSLGFDQVKVLKKVAKSAEK